METWEAQWSSSSPEEGQETASVVHWRTVSYSRGSQPSNKLDGTTHSGESDLHYLVYG